MLDEVLQELHNSIDMSWDTVYPVLLLQNNIQMVYYAQSLPVHFRDLCPMTLTFDIINLKCINI